MLLRKTFTILAVYLGLILCVLYVAQQHSAFSFKIKIPAPASKGISLNWSVPTLRIIKKQIGQEKKIRPIIDVGQQCRFPKLDINAPAIKHFFKDPEPLKCSTLEKNWVYVNNGTFIIDPEAVARHGGEITCNYSEIRRINDTAVGWETFQDFKSGSKLKSDFSKVNCKAPMDNATYSNLHTGIAPSEKSTNRSKSTPLSPDALGLKVYMLGFDSISRLTFMRKLPKLYEYLTEKMDAIVLEGYNIVGDGTAHALIPIFTGKTEEELPLTRKRYPNASYVNVYPFVWNE